MAICHPCSPSEARVSSLVSPAVRLTDGEGLPLALGACLALPNGHQKRLRPAVDDVSDVGEGNPRRVKKPFEGDLNRFMGTEDEHKVARRYRKYLNTGRPRVRFFRPNRNDEIWTRPILVESCEASSSLRQRLP